jgi:hypothetical protein
LESILQAGWEKLRTGTGTSAIMFLAVTVKVAGGAIPVIVKDLLMLAMDNSL